MGDRYCTKNKCQPRLEYKASCKVEEQGCKRDFVCRKKSFGAFGGSISLSSLKCRLKDKKFHETKCFTNESCPEDRYCPKNKCQPRLEYKASCKVAEQGCKRDYVCSKKSFGAFGGSISLSSLKC